MVDILKKYQEERPQSVSGVVRPPAEYGSIQGLVFKISGGRISGKHSINLILIFSAILISVLAITVYWSSGGSISPSEQKVFPAE